MAEAKAIRVHNERLKRLLIAEHESEVPDLARKIHVVPIPVDTRIFPVKKVFGSEKPSVAFVGSSTPWEGLEHLVRSLHFISKSEVTLVIYTTSPTAALRDTLSQVPAGIAVDVSSLPHRKLIETLPQHDLLVIPRPSNLVTETTTPIKLVEAMACGLPVLATAVGGITSYLKNRETGLVVRPGDEKALASGIDQILGNHELAKRLGRNARRFAETHLDPVQLSPAFQRIIIDARGTAS